MTLISPRPQPESAAYTIAVTVDWQSIRLDLAGDIDLAAARELTQTLERIDRMPAMALQVDMARVSFLDSTGVRPLVEAARRRRDHEQPQLLINSASLAVLRLLRAAGLGSGPALDVDGWDAFTHDSANDSTG
jgi:anti-sigma B factor antagonist